jgi:cephalosporin-C deacetylase-like acetyl esterase
MATLASRTRNPNMPREDISFQTADNVTLRGWFYRPPSDSHGNTHGKLPCLVMAHGFSAVKEMDLDAFASYFSTNLALTCLVYDNRGFGASDTAANEPRLEIIPSKQISDYSDAITYAQTREEVDRTKIGVWGSSYSGGHVLHVGAMDRRVKVVLSQLPMVDGWANFHRLIRPDFVGGMNEAFEQGRSPPKKSDMLSQQLTSSNRSPCACSWEGARHAAGSRREPTGAISASDTRQFRVLCHLARQV